MPIGMPKFRLIIMLPVVKKNILTRKKKTLTAVATLKHFFLGHLDF